MFLNLYNKSGHGQTLGGIVYSDRDKNTHTLDSPAFSFLGECTPEKYYRLLDEDLISEGLLPRFTTIEYLGMRGDSNKLHNEVQPDEDLIMRIGAIANHSIMLIGNKQCIPVDMDEESKRIFNEFNDKTCNGYINNSDTGGVSAELWTRSHVKAMKLAALIAVGVDPYHPMITKEYTMWAINIISHDNKNIISKFENGEISTLTTDFSQSKECLRVIKDYILATYDSIKKYKVAENMHKMGIVPYAYLNRRLSPVACYRTDKMGATFAIKRALQALMDSGDIQEVPKAQMEREFGTQWIS